MNYSLQTKSGLVEFESLLSAMEAARLVESARMRNDFANSLASSVLAGRRLSEKQRAWLIFLAEESRKPRKESTESFPRIFDMLVSARLAGKKFPKIRLERDGQTVVLVLTRSDKVNVTDGGSWGSNVWFGAILADGSVRPGRDYARVADLLRELEADPAVVAQQHGVATGSCCFCNRPLTTKESRSVGYGPICAENFGLPWGYVNPDFDHNGSLPLEL